MQTQTITEQVSLNTTEMTQQQCRVQYCSSSSSLSLSDSTSTTKVLVQPTSSSLFITQQPQYQPCETSALVSLWTFGSAHHSGFYNAEWTLNVNVAESGSAVLTHWECWDERHAGDAGSQVGLKKSHCGTGTIEIELYYNIIITLTLSITVTSTTEKTVTQSQSWFSD